MSKMPTPNRARSKAEAGRIVLTISQLTEQLKDCLQSRFSGLCVAGEISNLSRPASGHIYFSLKDGNASLGAAMWKTSTRRLQFDLEDGMQVVCQGGIDIYPPRGSYQLIVRRIELQGEGAMQRALRQLQERLKTEGLFDAEYKRPLPKYPRRIAVISSSSGAAIRDFLEVARRRWHGTQVLVLPVQVQGSESASQVVRAIELANEMADDLSVIVVTRGGGSMEDLWSFNDERVVRAIFASKIPVVSAIGHEIDVTLSDLVADVRALTPTEAAERVLPSYDEVVASLRHMNGRMTSVLRERAQKARAQLESVAGRRVLRHPEDRLRVQSQRLDELDTRMRRAVASRVDRSRQLLSQYATHLDSLSPLAVLRRGYSISRCDGRVVRTGGDVATGSVIRTRVTDAEIISRVTEIQTLP